MVLTFLCSLILANYGALQNRFTGAYLAHIDYIINCALYPAMESSKPAASLCILSLSRFICFQTLSSP